MGSIRRWRRTFSSILLFCIYLLCITTYVKCMFASSCLGSMQFKPSRSSIVLIRRYLLFFQIFFCLVWTLSNKAFRILRNFRVLKNMNSQQQAKHLCTRNKFQVVPPPPPQPIPPFYNPNLTNTCCDFEKKYLYKYKKYKNIWWNKYM